MKSAPVAKLPTRGRYSLVVDGGLRSVVQLHQLLNQSNDLRLQLVCPAGSSDQVMGLVKTLARSYDLPLASEPRSKILPVSTIDLEEAESYARQYGLAWIRTEPEPEDPLDLRQQELRSQQQLLNQAVDQRLSKLYYKFRSASGIQMPRSWLAQAPWDQIEALLVFTVRKLEPETIIDNRRTGEWVRLAKTMPAGHSSQLPGSLILRVDYDTVAVACGASPAAPLPVISLVPQTSLVYGPIRLSYGSHQAGEHQLKLPLGNYQVRSSRSGDRIQAYQGSRKLQDIFTDHRITRQRRANWPIVTDEAGIIIWIPLLATAKSVSESNDGYTLIAEEL